LTGARAAGTCGARGTGASDLSPRTHPAVGRRLSAARADHDREAGFGLVPMLIGRQALGRLPGRLADRCPPMPVRGPRRGAQVAGRRVEPFGMIGRCVTPLSQVT
jgi:hypothetical protein